MMIKKLSIFVLVLLVCSILPAPATAAASIQPPSPAIASMRVGDPDYPPAVEFRLDPSVSTFKVAAPPHTSRPGLQPSTLSITVDYLPNGSTNALGDSCVTYPPAAETAFTAAANILQSYITSPVQIRIEACWASLPAGVLGHSNAISTWRDFTNAPLAGTFYPVALANAYYGSDIDPPSDCTGHSPAYPATWCDDISIAYASDYASDFYFGTDGNPGGGLIDFESVVLHEIVHGLGFSGKLYAYQSGSTWYGAMSGQNYPRVYDTYTYDGNGVALLNTSTYPRPGTNLGSALLGGKKGVYFNGLNTRLANGGNGAKLYSPNPWQSGSSYSHLDEVFNGTPNALMTYAIDWGESNHALGPVAYGVLKDDGWAPQPVTNLHAALVGPAAHLTWTNNGGLPTGIRIERSPNGVDTWTSVITISNWNNSYDDGFSPGATYYYRVVAYNSLGDAFPSNVSEAVTIAAVATEVHAVPVSPTQINLTWLNLNPSSATAKVQRSLTGTGSWTVLTSSAAGGNPTGSYSDTTGLADGTHYFYQVILSYNGVTAGASNPADAWTDLNTPTTLVATAVSDRQINLTWKNMSHVATAYTVQRGTDGVTFPDTVTTAAPPGAYNTTTGFNDTGPLAENTRYYYRVFATNATPAVSLPSAPANAITFLVPPTNVTATAVSTTQINLSWTHNSVVATAYTVKRGTDGVNYPTTLTTTASLTGYNDTGPLTEGVHYYYQVIATSPIPAASLPVAANATALLATPTSLATSAPPTFTQVGLTWTNHSTHQTGYNVYRADNTPDMFVLKGSSTTTSYTDNSAAAGVQYYYKVTATNATGASAQSDQLAVLTPQVAPTSLLAARAGANVNLTWTDNSANETGFTVERSLDGSTGWTSAGTASLVPGVGGSGAFTDSDPFELAASFYRICAVNAVTCSAYVVSAQVPAGATLNAPQPVSSARMADPGSIRILWADNSASETGYQVQWTTDPVNGPWNDITPATAADVTSFDWATADGVYYVQARALASNPALDSPWTAPVRIIKSSNVAYFALVTK